MGAHAARIMIPTRPNRNACERVGTMTTHLTAGQRALIEAELVRRQHVLDQRVAEHRDGLTRAEHARELLLQDDDDAPQRESEREMELALTDLETQELGAVSEALRRLKSDEFGVCVDCGSDIPFDRLKIEPWALRCVGCESRREKAARGA